MVATINKMTNCTRSRILMTAMAFSLCVFQPTSAMWGYNPETEVRAKESVRRRLAKQYEPQHCQCNGTFLVCKESKKNKETCDADHNGYLSWGRGECTLEPCTFCHSERLRFNPSETPSEHGAEISHTGIDVNCPTGQKQSMLLFAGAPMSRETLTTHEFRLKTSDWTTLTATFEVKRLGPGGSVSVGLLEPSYHYCSDGSVYDNKLRNGLQKFAKGSKVTVSLHRSSILSSLSWNGVQKKLALTYSLNGKEVHSSELPENVGHRHPTCTKCDGAGSLGRFTCVACDGSGMSFQLCLRLQDAEVILVECHEGKCKKGNKEHTTEQKCHDAECEWVLNQHEEYAVPGF